MAFDLPAPLNYKFDTQDPADSVRKSIELGIGIQNADQQRQLHSLQMQEIQQKLGQQQLAQSQQQEFYSRNQALQQKPGGPSAQDLLDMMGMPGALPHVKEMQDRYNAIDDREKRAKTSTMNQVFNALDKGYPDVAKQVLLTNAEAAKNSGRLDEAKMWEGYASQDPVLAKTNIGSALAVLDPKFAENYTKLKTADDVAREAKAKAGIEENTLAHADETSKQTLATGRAAELSSKATTEGTTQKTAQEKESFPLSQRVLGAQVTTSEAAAKEATEQQKAKTLKEQADARTADIASRFKEALEKEGVKGAQYDNIIKRVTAGNAPALQKAELGTAQANKEIKTTEAEGAKDVQEAALNASRAATDKIRFEMNNLPEPVGEKVNGYVESATTSQRAATRANDLISNMQQKIKGLGSGGWSAKIADVYKSVTGQENDISKLRLLYNQTINDKALENASSHGAAAIIRLRQNGFPPNTAGLGALLPILKDIAGVHMEVARQSNLKADWTSQNRSLGPATKDLMVDGQLVPKGTSFRTFANPPTQEQSPKPVHTMTPEEIDAEIAHLTKRK